MAGQVIGKIKTGGVEHLIASTALGYSSTSAGDNIKVVDIGAETIASSGSGSPPSSNIESIFLHHGMTIHVQFEHENTASDPELSIGGVSKPIYYQGEALNSNYSWPAKSIVTFTLSGNAWYMNGFSPSFSSGSSGYALTRAGTWEAFTNNTGTVTEVATGTGLIGGPITSTGTISLADNYGEQKNPYSSKTKNYVLATPTNASGLPDFRELDPSDIPNLSANKITSDQFDAARIPNLSGGKITSGTVSASVIDTAIARLSSPIFTGTPKAPTLATSSIGNYIATTSFVNDFLKINDSMRFKGTLGTGGTITALPNSHQLGDTYKIITAGTYAGKVCEIGDMIICISDGTAENNDHWTVVQTNIDGAVIGPSSAESSHVAIFDGNTGKLIKDSSYTIAKSVPSNAEFTDTTYEFASGTNGFTVTPAGGTAQTITVTPSIANNITGSGTSGYLVKFNGKNTITNGPQLGSSTIKYLNQKGDFADVSIVQTTTYSADTSTSIYPLMTTSATGATNKNLYTTNFYSLYKTANNSSAYLNIGTTNTISGGITLHHAGASSTGFYHDLVTETPTAYRQIKLPNKTGTVAILSDIPTAGSGLTTSGTVINHSNSVTAQNTEAVYPIKIDAQGHISKYGSAVTSMTPTSHTHGNIQNDGTLQSTDVSIASGDKLVITDSSNSNKVARTSITFDKKTTTKALTPNGTWEDFTNNEGTVTSVGISASGALSVSGGPVTSSGTITISHSTATGYKHIPSGGSSGQFLKWSSDGTATWAADNDTKNTAGSTDNADRLFLIGAATQAANPQTYSNINVHITNGTLRASEMNISDKVTLQWNDTTQALDFVFA